MHNILIIHRCICRFIIYTYVRIYIKVYYRGLAHMIVDTGKSKICSVSAGLRPRGADGTIPVLRQSSGEFPLFKSSSTKKASLFVPVRPSTDWMRPTHIIFPKRIQRLIGHLIHLQVMLFLFKLRHALTLIYCKLNTEIKG